MWYDLFMQQLQQKGFRVALCVVVLLAALVLLLSVYFPLGQQVTGEPQRGAQEHPRASWRDSSAFADVRLPKESSNSNDPVEQAIANGTILDTRITSSASDRYLQRVLLLKTGIQPRPVRVVERWEVRNGKATLQSREMFLADQVMIRVPEGVDSAKLQQSLESARLKVLEEIATGLFTLRLPSTEIDAVPKALEALAAHPDIVKSAEADGVGFGGGVPNDTEFGNQWGHRNTGQFGGSVVGTDVDAPEMWDILGDTSGLVIAVLDSGLNLTHPDLQNVAWINPGEISGDGLDNDGNGRIDDFRGWDFVNNDNNPTDDHGHGTNVTGIIAATRNNAVGIAGMLSGVRILVSKILNSSNSGSTSQLIAGLAYARGRGVPVINLSLQNYPFSTSLNAEISLCDVAGIILVAGAGNQARNNDVTPNYPSSYLQANIISVGNHGLANTRWNGTTNPSNFGSTTVDIFAPGQLIRSTHTGTSYAYFTGTSQATAYVSAVCGAIKHINPQWTAAQIKAAVLESIVSTTAYQGICVSGGRLNAVQAIAESFLQNPTMDTDSDQIPNLIEYLAGTLISDPDSAPAIASEIVGGVFQISIPRVSRPEATLQVEASPDLINWGTAGVVNLSVAGTLIGGTPLLPSTNTFLRIKAVPTAP